MRLKRFFGQLPEWASKIGLSIFLLILSSVFCWDTLQWSTYLPDDVAIPVLHMVSEMAAFGAMFGFSLALVRDALIDGRSKLNE